MEYVEKLVKESPDGMEGCEVDGRVVARLLAWVALRSSQSAGAKIAYQFVSPRTTIG